jgi:hypothetical protein
MSKRDLFVVVPDLDMENAIKTLLCHRQRSLGIQLGFNPDRPPQGDLLRYAGRDSGCFKDAVDILRPPQRTHQHAILIFDHDGCGGKDKEREQIELEVERQLCANGWDDDNISVVVIEPELETWVWAKSPHVATVLGWHDNPNELRPFLEKAGLWDSGAEKPKDPKAAMRAALRKQGTPLGARIFTELATHVGVAECRDAAFRKLRSKLMNWFGKRAHKRPDTRS